MNKSTGLRGLSTVRVDKNSLLNKLIENRKNHKAVYEKALEKWRLKTIKVLNNELEKVKNRKEYQPIIYVQKPNNYTKYYDSTIDLLQASLDDEFELTSKEFSQYVRDEWSWKEAFMTTVSGCYSE